jgi:hypothetical protein
MDLIIISDYYRDNDPEDKLSFYAFVNYTKNSINYSVALHEAVNFWLNFDMK